MTGEISTLYQDNSVRFEGKRYLLYILECLTPSFRRSDPYVDKYGISWVLR